MSEGQVYDAFIEIQNFVSEHLPANQLREFIHKLEKYRRASNIELLMRKDLSFIKEDEERLSKRK